MVDSTISSLFSLRSSKRESRANAIIIQVHCSLTNQPWVLHPIALGFHSHHLLTKVNHWLLSALALVWSVSAGGFIHTCQAIIATDFTRHEYHSRLWSHEASIIPGTHVLRQTQIKQYTNPNEMFALPLCITQGHKDSSSCLWQLNYSFAVLHNQKSAATTVFCRTKSSCKLITRNMKTSNTHMTMQSHSNSRRHNCKSPCLQCPDASLYRSGIQK